MAVANYVATNEVIAPSLGRNVSQSANATVNLIAPGDVPGDIIKQLDLAFAEIIRAGRTRPTAKVELFNLVNSNNVLAENANYAAFRAPFDHPAGAVREVWCAVRLLRRNDRWQWTGSPLIVV
jgi:hypothetical protein